MLIALARILEHEEHLAIQLLWATDQLLVGRVSPAYLVEQFFYLFLMQLKKMRTLGESKVSSFDFSQGNKRGT